MYVLIYFQIIWTTQKDHSCTMNTNFRAENVLSVHIISIREKHFAIFKSRAYKIMSRLEINRDFYRFLSSMTFITFLSHFYIIKKSHLTF